MMPFQKLIRFILLSFCIIQCLKLNSKQIVNEFINSMNILLQNVDTNDLKYEHCVLNNKQLNYYMNHPIEWNLIKTYKDTA